MTETKTDIDLVNDEVKIQRALAVMEARIKGGLTVARACEVCNVPESTFYRWVQDGVLEDYLKSCQNARAETASTMAAEALPDVIKFMIEIASGVKTVRGANPVTAAQFLFEIAGVSDKPAEEAEGQQPQVHMYIPQFVTFATQHGAPATNDEGQMIVLDEDVVEGEVVEEKEPQSED